MARLRRLWRVHRRAWSFRRPHHGFCPWPRLGPPPHTATPPRLAGIYPMAEGAGRQPRWCGGVRTNSRSAARRRGGGHRRRGCAREFIPRRNRAKSGWGGGPEADDAAQGKFTRTSSRALGWQPRRTTPARPAAISGFSSTSWERPCITSALREFFGFGYLSRPSLTRKEGSFLTWKILSHLHDDESGISNRPRMSA